MLSGSLAMGPVKAPAAIAGATSPVGDRRHLREGGAFNRSVDGTRPVEAGPRHGEREEESRARARLSAAEQQPGVRRNFHAVRGIAGMSQDSILAWVVAHMNRGQQMVLPCCP